MMKLKSILELMNLNEEHYTAIANLGAGKRVKANLDSFHELQKWMNDMANRHAISAEVTKINQQGKSQTIHYDYDGRKWVETKRGSVR